MPKKKDDDLEVLDTDADTSYDDGSIMHNGSSFGSSLTDPSLMNQGAMINGSGDDGAYTAKQVNPGSINDGIMGNPKNTNSRPAPTKEEKEQAQGQKINNMVDKAIKVGQFVPGYGQALKGVEIAKKAAEKIPGVKKLENKVLANAAKASPVGMLTGGGMGFGDKSDTEGKTSEGGSGGDEQKGSLTGSLKGIKKAIIIGPIAFLSFALFFLFIITQGNKVQANTMNFASSKIRGEELIEGDIDYTAESSNSKEERRYITNLSEVYAGNNRFNPDLVSSTFQVMMFRSQYSEEGYFDYSHISREMIDELAKLLEGSQVKSGNGGSGTGAVSTIDGVVAVASDANLVPPFGSMVPENLVDTGRPSLDDSGTCVMTNEAIAAFQVMEAAAAADGVTIGTNSCYRSAAEQAHTSGNSPAAAGYSEHQLGSTVDIANRDRGYIDTPAVNNWLYANAETYGFINRHWDMANETHHFRFVGSAVAALYGKYKTSTSGRPRYSMSYPAFVQTEEFQQLFNSRGSSSSNSSRTTSAGGTASTSATSSIPTSGANSSTSSSSSSSSSKLGSPDAIIAIAEQEIGTGEGPGGVTKYGQWYGIPAGAWCAMFVSWCANQAGVSEEVIPKIAYVPNYTSWFQSNGTWHGISEVKSGTYTPQKGDLIIYSGSRHVGLVKAYDNGTITTIEGNTTGDQVREKEFNVFGRDVMGFGNPQYTNKASSSSTGTGNVNTDERYRTKLKDYVMKYMPKLDDDRADLMVTEIFDFKNDYYDLIGKRFDDCSNTVRSSAGSCTYTVQGVGEVSDLKVRLMNCSSSSLTPVEGEDLVDFEKYVLGVTYAEIGEGAPTESVKAQAIAARSYALTRRKPTQEDGQWILEMKACTMDQVYCDPDQGCTKIGGENGLTRSGTNSGGSVYKRELAADSPFREAVASTNGMVLVNAQGEILNTGYVSTVQNQWMSMARSGSDYSQILLQYYGSKGASKIEESPCDGASGTSSSSSSCSSDSENYSAPGDYASWRQWAKPWGDFVLANDGSTMGDIGCTITAIAMLIAKSGVPTGNITDFNPGTFAQALKAAGITGGDGNTSIGRVNEIVPGFQYVGKYEFNISSNSNAQGNAEKVAKAKELIDQGYYVLVSGSSMYGNGGHWVAIDRVEGDKIIMMDPYRDDTDMLNTYRATYAFHYYKAVR